jgi:hypothetical protein
MRYLAGGRSRYARDKVMGRNTEDVAERGDSRARRTVAPLVLAWGKARQSS